ncbi:hypothetical protein SERLADRAFT_433756 [Serpula lacrymans var. lacrymans S7.9]|uniref:Uncharacterized protein n=1 Tax=Serpula lacrymans var. lacrymans (strain S7.9) TaxID=578457 RepID=F8NIN9_SERL9|nr:uncharacterized protein SERLADRAFT_433756 [Serpula lacrymans var. lacrymans S7.9]EGO29801.1 hypothetical protein SERLADRAFT_433756 [Serpula lacrymans var. lacrymans S7.9]
MSRLSSTVLRLPALTTNGLVSLSPPAFPFPLATSLASAPPSPSPSSQAPPQSANHNDTSSLLFGFLISILSVFGVFMVGGMVWHRLVVRRRILRRVGREGVPQRYWEMTRPHLWEIRTVSGEQHIRWKHMKPLMVQSRRESDPLLVSDDDTSLPSWKQWFLARLPRDLRMLFSRPRHLSQSQANSHENTQLEPRLPLPGSDVQVAVIVAMPRPSKATSALNAATAGKNKEVQGTDDRQEVLHEIVIGTTNLLYKDDDSCLEDVH